VFLFFYYNQQTQNYLTKASITTVVCVIYTPTCFDIFVIIISELQPMLC